MQSHDGADKLTTSKDCHGSCLEHSNSYNTSHCHKRTCDPISHDGATQDLTCHSMHSHDIESLACSGSSDMILTEPDKCSSATDNHDCLEHNSCKTLHCDNRSCGPVNHDEASFVPFIDVVSVDVLPIPD